MLKKMHKMHKKGFTLVELLAVLTVMAIVMTMALPTFKGIFDGRKMNGAINQLRNTISLARQHAILNGSRVCIVIPDCDSFATYASDDVDKCLTSYAAYDITQTNYITEWTYLPEGIVFDVDAVDLDAPSGIGTYDNVLDYSNPVSLPFPESSSTKKGTFRAIDFFSDGTCEISKPVVFFLTEGRTIWPLQGGALNPSPPQYIKTPNGTTNALILYTRGGRFEVVRDE